MIKLAALSIFILPLISFIINGIFRNKLSKTASSYVACTSITITAISAVYIFCSLINTTRPILIHLFNWIALGDLQAAWTIYIDRLSATMFLVVTSVSAVVHIYSIGYMEHEKSLQKFFSFLSLFTFFMLILVASNNFLQLFCGWEGVGLCSYLLIGFWYEKPSANNAALKAFIVNRISDFAFILGIILIYSYTATVNFNEVFAGIPLLTESQFGIAGMTFNTLDLICLLLFIGCMGKSAQIGLHVWLPDAMEGPTPVSALIHAATMVTAGVFLLARCSYLFEYSIFVLKLITIVGGITAIFGAIIAVTQTDIKKIIAYSTCSQLGYMFLACGLSAYRAAIFHLVTHAFFKALLFLSAGSVIHMSGEQDITRMGSLKDKMPITYANFLAASLAIVGIYPLAGFYSKDAILESAFGVSPLGNAVFLLGIIAASFTAIYSTKIIILAFHSNALGPEIEKEKISIFKKLCGAVYKLIKGRNESNTGSGNLITEAPKIMNIPLILLIAGTFCAGMIGHYILRFEQENGYLLNSVFSLHNNNHDSIPLIVKLLPSFVGILGILIGVLFYYKFSKDKKYLELKDIKVYAFMYNIIKNKFYFDEIYNLTVVKFISNLSMLLSCIDSNFIDKFGPGALTNIINYASFKTRKLQTGYIFNYVFIMITVLACFMTYYIIILIRFF